MKARSVASRSVGIVADSAYGFWDSWRLEVVEVVEVKETRRTKHINFA